jgi:hypothetical protein
LAEPGHLLRGQDGPVAGAPARFRDEEPDRIGSHINDGHTYRRIRDGRIRLVDWRIRGGASVKSANATRQSSIPWASLLINDLSGDTTMDFSCVIVTRPGLAFRGLRTYLRKV